MLSKINTKAEINRIIRQEKQGDNLTKRECIAKFIEYRRALIEKIGKCKRCGSKYNLTLDHIIPIELLPEFGIDPERMFDEEDLRLLCYACNQLKGRHLDFSDKRTKKLIIKYLKNFK